MKFSSNYIFYPDSSELIKAIEHYKSLPEGAGAGDDAADGSAAVQDNSLHTRGNFEHHHFSTRVLESACSAFESRLAGLSQEQSALEWAALQNSLGNVLAALAQQQMDVELYESAIAAFDSALEVLTQQDSPAEWAVAQYNLGTATQALGRQQGDSKLLKTSVDAYTDALLVWTREQDPDEWAACMYQLGVSFYEHGKLLRGNRTFQKSVVAFKNALAAFDADSHALALAATHNSRGAALRNLGESEENADRLHEALRAYNTALTVCMEQQLPFHLAVLCRVNRATTQAVLAELTNDAVIAEEAADELEVISEASAHACTPGCLEHCRQQRKKLQEMFASLR